MTANWKNRTLWTADNLDILRGMNSDSADLIYLDPPFNSKQNYAAPIGSRAAGAAFKDTWTLDDVDLAWHGEIAERQPALYAILDAAGHSHSKSTKSYLIMMAVRLLEMKRIIKTSGSIYLHCDPTAGHYLKMLMDSIFGAEYFRNEIIWGYGGRGAKAVSRQFPRNHDLIFLYGAEKGRKHRRVYKEILHPLHKLPSHIRIDKTGKPYKTSPRGDYTDASIARLEKENRIHRTSSGNIRIKYFLELRNSTVVDRSLVGDCWDDIPDMMHTPKDERTGYPTQKPLALLSRIIEASSDEGDMVLDPFCGCATTCVAAEHLGRQWAGIDLSAKALELVKFRLKKDTMLAEKVLHRNDIPQRSDLGKLPNYRTHKHSLYGIQEGCCKGCLHFFEFRHLEVDHIVPKARGGSEHPDNLQLLCSSCNRRKGNSSHEELVAKLTRDGLRRDHRL